jgi:hypothetical protein
VPHFTTFQKAADRLLLARRARKLLDETLRIARQQKRLKSRCRLAALDGTGWESHHVSSYYVNRRASCSKFWQKTTYKTFPKAGVLCDVRTHLILALVPGRGPGPDIKHFRRALDEALSRQPIDALVADAGYDAEHSHEYAREECGVNTFIPPLIGRPTKKPPSGYWRRRMTRVLKRSRYTQRWQAETVNSMLKRLMGSALRARRYQAKCRELHLRALTLNVMIVRRKRVFYRAIPTPYLFPTSRSTGPICWARESAAAARSLSASRGSRWKKCCSSSSCESIRRAAWFTPCAQRGRQPHRHDRHAPGRRNARRSDLPRVHAQ